MFISVVKNFDYYLSVLYKNKEDVHFLTRLQVVDNMISFDNFSELSEQEKEIFLDFTSYYWFKEDLQENTLFDICWLVNEKELYKIKDYKEFKRKLDELV